MGESPWPDDFPHHKVTFPDPRPPRRRGWVVVVAVFVFLAGLGTGRATADEGLVTEGHGPSVWSAPPVAATPAPVLARPHG